MTIFKDRLQEAGFSRLRFDATAFAKNFFELGGTLDLWTEIGTAAAAEMGKNGQKAGVQNDQIEPADLSRPMPSEGHSRHVHQDLCNDTDARYPMPEGQHSDVQQDRRTRADGLPIAGEASKNLPEQGPGTSASTRDPIPGEGQNKPVQQDSGGRANAGKPIASGGGQTPTAERGQDRPAPAVREPSAEYLRAMGLSRLEAARSILYRYKTSTGEFWGDVKPYEVGSMARDHLRGVALMTACGPLNPKQMKMPFAKLLNAEQARLAMEKADRELVNVA